MKRTILVIFFLIYAFYNCVGETVEPASDVSDSMANRDDINPADTEEDFGRDTSATDISSKDTSVSDIYDSGIYEDIYVGDIFPSDTVDLADSNTDISDTSDATTDISPDTSLSDTGTNNSSVKIIFPDTYECENPCTFRVEASENIVKVRYLADDKWEIGKSENRSNGFEIQYRFTTLGKRVIYAYAYESKDENAQIVASDNREYLIKEAKGNKFGVWLWYIEGTGLTHTELAQ
ncbi:MAG: hypothetical protein N3B13_09590, partial [Deltaproteobacteria bacterium]|nr:hypothetical protein [Deltaproteobacteria bacterium]